MATASLTLVEAQFLLMAPKDVGGAEVEWVEARLPASGALMMAFMMFGVSARGHDLIVRGEWKGPGEDQIFLKAAKNSRGNLARLCLTGKHAGSVHWHVFESVGLGEEYRGDVTYDVGKGPEVGELFENVFVPTLQIHNLRYQKRWIS